MKVSSVCVRTLVVCLVAAGVAGAACDRDRPPAPTASTQTSRTPDMPAHEFHSRGLHARVFTAHSNYGRGALDKAVARPDMTAVIQAFSERGFNLKRDEGIVIEGEKDGTAVRAFVSIMVARGSSSDEIWVVGIERDDRFGITPALVTQAPDKETGRYLQLGDDRWLKTFSVHDVFPSAGRIDDDFWNGLWFCMLQRMPSYTVQCSLMCAYSLLGYGQCWWVCMASNALGDLTHCLIQITWGGGTQYKQE